MVGKISTWAARLKSVFAGAVLGLSIPSLVFGQTATLLPDAQQRYLSNSGAPVANGSVTYYIPNTTTKKTIWTNSGETTPATNPVILDAGGKPQPTGQTYGDGCYQQVVEDSNNVQIWSAVTCSTGTGGGSTTTTSVGDGLAVGTVLTWSGLVLPTNYVYASGQALSRTTYPQLLSAVTLVQSAAVCTATSTTLAGLTDTSQLPVGAAIEGTCIPPSTTVVSKSTNSVVMSNPATASLSTPATFFPFGDGDGASTFNVPNYNGQYLMGRCNANNSTCSSVSSLYFGADPNALNIKGGAQLSTLLAANLPPYTPVGNITNGAITFANSHNTSSVNGTLGAVGTNSSGTPNDLTSTLSPAQATSTFTGTAQGGTSTAFSRLPPTTAVNYVIKVLPDSTTKLALNVLSASRLATTTSLPANTYNNGASGVGTTLTAISNGTLSIDSTAVAASNQVLIKNEATQANNGIYTVVQAGDGSHPYILVRATFFDQASEMVAGTYTVVTAGTTNASSSWISQSSITTVGTDNVIFNQFSAPVFIKLAANLVTPEQFYQTSDGADYGLAFDRAMVFLSATGGTLQLGCGTTYTSSTISPNGQALVRLFTNVNIIGCGPSSVIRMADNVNTSSASFAYGLSNTNTLSNVLLANFTIDMNGANNSCGGTCYHSNAAIAAVAGDRISLENVTFLNNPGSNDTVFGTNVQPPTVTNLSMIGLVHEHSGDAVNTASADWSGDFFIATNVTYSNIRHSDGPRVNGSAFELHGTNIAASNIVVTDHFNCGIIAAEPSGAANITTNVNLNNVSCNNVKGGVQIAAKSGAIDTNVLLSNVAVHYLSGSSGIGVDACTVMNAASGPNANLSVSGIVVSSDVTTNLGNEAPAVDVCFWKNALVNGVQVTNSQGPAVNVDQIVSGGMYTISNVQATNPGRTSTTANQVAVLFKNTSAATAGVITINHVTSTGTIVYNVSGAVNATQTIVSPDSLGVGVTSGHVNWTGAGLSNMIWPQCQFNFRGSGGTGQFVKQTSVGGCFSVSAVLWTEITGLGAGVATAGGNAINTAGGLLVPPAALATNLMVQGGGSGAGPSTFTLAGDCTFSTPNITCLKTNGVSFGTLATVAPGTGVAAALAIATGTAGSFVVNGGALGTPSSGNGSNLTNLNGANVTAGTLNANSRECFGTGNNIALTQNSTFFFTYGYAAGAESVVSLPMPQAVTFKNLFVSTATAPAVGATFTLTARKNAADQTLTCAVTSAGTTCNDTTHSFSAAAGDLIAMKLVTSATSGTGAGMNVCMQAVTASP